MKRFRFVGYLAAAIACDRVRLAAGVVGRRRRASIVPAGSRPAVAATAPSGSAQSPTISDVSLGEGGILTGQVLTGQGAPLPQSTVIVRGIGSEAITTISDPQGRFAIRGLKGGTYEVVSGGGYGVFRAVDAQCQPAVGQQTGDDRGRRLDRPGSELLSGRPVLSADLLSVSRLRAVRVELLSFAVLRAAGLVEQFLLPCNSCGCGPCGGYCDPWHITNGQIVTGTAIAGLVAAVIAVSVSNHSSSPQEAPSSS